MIIVIMKLPGCQEAIHTCIRQYADKAVFIISRMLEQEKNIILLISPLYIPRISPISPTDYPTSLKKKAARRVTKPGQPILLRYMQYMLKLIDMETKCIHIRFH